MRRVAVITLTLLLCACAAPQAERLTYAPPDALPTSVLLENVPFFAQQAYYCGPAALAMAMNFHGLRVTQKELARSVYVPDLKGSLQAEMRAAIRERGLLAYVLAPNLRSLLKEIAAEHPVVVLQNLGVNWYPAWHYAVAIGYDLEAQEIILHSGRHPRYRTPLATFERTWARSEYWALVPLPPSQLPRDGNPMSVLKAAAALEETGQTRAAQQAYAAAVRRWPSNLIARIGLGNTFFALGNKPAALRAFVAAIRIDSEVAAAWNNLAVTLADLGCKSTAQAAARRAANIEETDRNYRATLAHVKTTRVGAGELVKCPPLMVVPQKRYH
jgi:tetratricopeptide (TPR) repeat protein